uniref:Uncharacterized protein n=1 Tax=Chelonoidis abingdonii TaxID=106734 RepID=A0A8C0FXH1_CHEAB
MPFLRILSTFLVLLSLLLLLIALGSDFWVADNAGGHMGLWKSCSSLGCARFPSVPGKGRQLCQGSHLCHQPAPQGRTRTPGGVCAVPFAPGLCAMIALAVFTGEFNGAVKVLPDQVAFDWSFGLGWVSFLLFLITGECNIGKGVPRGPLLCAQMQPSLGWDTGAGYKGTHRLVLRCSHLWGGAQGVFIWGRLTWC